MADKELTCRDCGNLFTFNEGEQKFYEAKQFTPPTRCVACRKKKKEARERFGN